MLIISKKIVYLNYLLFKDKENSAAKVVKITSPVAAEVKISYHLNT